MTEVDGSAGCRLCEGSRGLIAAARGATFPSSVGCRLSWWTVLHSVSDAARLRIGWQPCWQDRMGTAAVPCDRSVALMRGGMQRFKR